MPVSEASRAHTEVWRRPRADTRAGGEGIMVHGDVRRQWRGAAIVATAVVGLAACTQEGTQTSGPQIEDKTVRVTLASPSMKVSFLSVQVLEPKVVQRVEQGTGKVVSPPVLRATVKVKNTSEDQAARLISGEVKYLGQDSQPIQLAKDRTDTGFKFLSYEDRLDPGMEASRDVEVPFPAVALADRTLQEIRLEVDYIPLSFKRDAVKLKASLAQ
jgi:hypothetical protein